MTLNVEMLLQILQTGSIFLGILVTVGTLKSRKEEDVGRMVELVTDIRYIKQAVSKIDNLDRRLTVVEEAMKHAEQRE